MSRIYHRYKRRFSRQSDIGSYTLNDSRQDMTSFTNMLPPLDTSRLVPQALHSASARYATSPDTGACAVGLLPMESPIAMPVAQIASDSLSLQRRLLVDLDPICRQIAAGPPSPCRIDRLLKRGGMHPDRSSTKWCLILYR